MGKQKEGSLQERIQKIVEKRGGYCKKNWGSMISEPGVADITVGFQGLYISIEVKVDDNEPTRQQGIHCRNVWKAGNIAMVAWTTSDVHFLLDIVYNHISEFLPLKDIINKIHEDMIYLKLDDGMGW